MPKKKSKIPKVKGNRFSPEVQDVDRELKARLAMKHMNGIDITPQEINKTVREMKGLVSQSGFNQKLQTSIKKDIEHVGLWAVANLSESPDDFERNMRKTIHMIY